MAERVRREDITNPFRWVLLGLEKGAKQVTISYVFLFIPGSHGVHL
jgi:hypothetical protein